MAAPRPVSKPTGLNSYTTWPALLVSLLVLSTPAAMAQEKQVRLLIPVLTGQEFELVRALVPGATIISLNGETFLEVGSFSDARVAHRLGRSIQKRLAIPFDLAYDPGHPQIALALGIEAQAQKQTIAKIPALKPVNKPTKTDLALSVKPPAGDLFWQPLAANKTSVNSIQAESTAATTPAEANAAVSTKPADSAPATATLKPTLETASTAVAVTAATQQVPSTAASPKPKPLVDLASAQGRQPSPGNAPLIESQTRTASITTEQIPVESTPIQTPAAEVAGKEESTETRATKQEIAVAPSLTAPAPAPSTIERLLKTAKPQASGTTGVMPRLEESVAPDAFAVVAPDARPYQALTTTEAKSKVKAEASAHDQSPTAVANNAEVKSVKPHPWLRPVEIAAVNIGVPLSRMGVALNPELNYLYVRIQRPADVAKLNQITPVLELNPVGDTVIARVGVFTKSRTGQRLMDAQISKLRAQQVELIIADGARRTEQLA